MAIIRQYTGRRGPDVYTKLLLHCNGADGSQVIYDETRKAVSVVGTAQLDTAQSVFGSSSLLFDGNSDLVTALDSEDWNFGSGDFTLDLRVRFASTSGVQGLINQYYQTGHRAFLFFVNVGASIYFYFCTGSGDGTSFYVSYSFSINTWYHIAVVRSANSLYFFVNGVQAGTTKDVTGLSTASVTQVLSIGAYQATEGWVSFLNGHLDEVRVSKGIARWTANFTPPTRPY